MGRVTGINSAIGEDENVDAVFDGFIGSGEEIFHGCFEAVPGNFVAETGLGVVSSVHETAGGCFELVADGQFLHLEAIEIEVLDAGEGFVVDDGIFQPDHAAVVAAGIEQVALRAEKTHTGGDQFLPDRVDGRVGHLGKKLAKIIVKQLRTIRQHGHGRVVAHRAERLIGGLDGGPENETLVLEGVAEGAVLLHQIVPGDRIGGFGFFQVIEKDAIFFEPIAVFVGRWRFSSLISSSATMRP